MGSSSGWRGARKAIAITLSTGALLSAAACRLDTGVVTTPAPASARTSRPDAPLCERLSTGDLAAATGGTATLVTGGSNETVCTYEIDSATVGRYSIAVRTEDSFESLEQVESSLAGGSRLEVAGRSAYWAPAVTTIWLERDTGLYAVQLLGVEGANAAETLGESVATAIAPSL